MSARTIQWEWQLLLGTEETSFLVACPYLLVGNWLEYVGIIGSCLLMTFFLVHIEKLERAGLFFAC